MKNKAAQELGSKGGQAKSAAKAKAAKENGKKGGRPGIYSVTEVTKFGEEKLLGCKMYKGAAVDLAEKHAEKEDVGIYVSFFRIADSQTVYLNPDGSHGITGKSWA